MRRRTPIFAAIDDQSVSSGLQPDRHSLKQVLWESAANVTFWNGTVRRKIPPAPAYTATISNTRVCGLAQQYMSTGTRRVWSAHGAVGHGADIYYWSFGGPTPSNTLAHYVEDTGATQRATIVDFTPYGDWMLVNSSYPGDPAKLLKEGIGWFDFNAAPSGVCRFLKNLSFLMAIGYGTRGTQVGWSDANNVELWTPASTNTAGSLAIDEFNTPIRAGSKLGDSVAVYSEDQLALVRYIGLPYIFGQKTVIDGIGAIGKAAVASDTRVNVGMGRAGAWWTDGNSARYIDEGYISNYFQDNITWAQGAKIVVCRNDFTGCFEFHIPVRGSLNVNEAWSWDPRTGGWSPIPPFTMMDERRLFDHVLYGTVDSKVLLGDFDPTVAGPLSLVTRPLIMTSPEGNPLPHVTARVDEVDLMLRECENVEWQMGCCSEPNGDWEWTEWLPASAGAKIYEVPAGDPVVNTSLSEQPFWKLALRSKSGQDNWALDLQGFLLYGAITGTKM